MANACVMNEPQEQMPKSRQLGQRLRASTSTGNSTKHFNRDSTPVHLIFFLALTGHERKDHMQVIKDLLICVGLGLVFIDPSIY